MCVRFCVVVFLVGLVLCEEMLARSTSSYAHLVDQINVQTIQLRTKTHREIVKEIPVEHTVLLPPHVVIKEIHTLSQILGNTPHNHPLGQLVHLVSMAHTDYVHVRQHASHVGNNKTVTKHSEQHKDTGDRHLRHIPRGGNNVVAVSNRKERLHQKIHRSNKKHVGGAVNDLG